MRSPFVIAVALGLAGGGPLLAQSYPIKASVIVPTVQVRSGPTDKFYVTSELHQNDAVTVLRPSKEPGWLEIVPPRGSFTWINAKYVRKVDDYQGHVNDDDPKFVAPALVGSEINNDKPAEARPGFLAGTIVYVVAAPRVANGETWLPVRPDLREVRYIPANAVNLPNWSVASKSNNPPAAPIPGFPSNHGAAPGNTTSFSPTPPVASIPGPPAKAPPAAQTFEAKWSVWGTLQKTTFAKDGRPMYVLVNPRGEPLMYATCRPGENLDAHVNRFLCLYGQVVNQPDPNITVPYMIATYFSAR